MFFVGEGTGEVMFGCIQRARFPEKSFRIAGYQWFNLIKCDIVCTGNQ